MQLKDVLLWLTTAGAGYIAYWAVGQYGAQWSATAKRWAAYGVAAVIALAAYLVQIPLGYVVAPVGATAWIETLFGVAFAASGVSQIIHGLTDLPDKGKITLTITGVNRAEHTHTY
jgi:uncharacterized membrane protein HdeD (DUF308 family)